MYYNSDLYGGQIITGMPKQKETFIGRYQKEIDQICTKTKTKCFECPLSDCQLES